MAVIDWNPTKFSAFAGPAKLDATFLKASLDPRSNKLLLDKDIVRFYTWINAIRADPSACGILPDFVDSVKQVLLEFFPLSEDGKTIKVRRIHDKGNTSGERTIDSIQVLFGASKNPLRIVDASTSLGYIFSVAKPTVDSPTWHSYYLPLQVLLCRCLYLAFISHEIGTKKISSVADVPRRSCVMYVGKEATPQRYLFNSDYPTAPSNSGDKETERRAQMNALDVWRRSAILNPAIKQVPLAVGESLPTIPPLAPWYRQQLADLLYRDLYQNSVLAKASLVAWTGLLTTFNAQYLAGPPQQTVPPLPLPLARLKGHKQVGAQLEQSLLEIVDFRVNPKSDPTSLDKSFIGFFKCFLTPHTFLPTDLSFEKEIVEPKSFGTVRDAAITAFWAASRSDVIKVLDSLYVLHQRQKIPQIRPFGRCAETYCITSVLPDYFPWLGMHNPSMGDLRGIALNVLEVGSSLLFQDSFTSAELGKVSAHGRTHDHARIARSCYPFTRQTSVTRHTMQT